MRSNVSTQPQPTRIFQEQQQQHVLRGEHEFALEKAAVHLKTDAASQVIGRPIDIDATALTIEAHIEIPCIRLKVNQFQFLADVLFHRWGRDGKNGGYIADGTGFGNGRL